MDKIPFSAEAVANGYWEVYHDDDCDGVITPYPENLCLKCGMHPDLQSRGARRTNKEPSEELLFSMTRGAWSDLLEGRPIGTCSVIKDGVIRVERKRNESPKPTEEVTYGCPAAEQAVEDVEGIHLGDFIEPQVDKRD